MHWILQTDLYGEPGRDALAITLKEAGVPFSEHKVVPFANTLDPEISPEGPTIVMGTLPLCRIALRHGWQPGCFDVSTVTWDAQMDAWGPHLLNSDAYLGWFGGIEPTEEPVFFIKPVAEEKIFAGQVIDKPGFHDWQERILHSREQDGSGLTPTTLVLWAALKTIEAEYRLWIVDGRVVTASRYRPASPNVPVEAMHFGQRMAHMWAPLPAYVMDVCRSEGEWKIVELNTLNACGFYAADVSRIVHALEQWAKETYT